MTLSQTKLCDIYFSHFTVFLEYLYKQETNKKNIFKKLYYRKMASEVEETLKRLVSHKGVIGTIVVNNEGVRRKYSIK